MAGEATFCHKRKRDVLQEFDAPALKKPTSEWKEYLAHSPAARETYRAEIRNLYVCYEHLYQGRDPNNDGLAFKSLLDAVDGSSAARRLAARLIPRFLHKFPHLVDSAANILLNLVDPGFQDRVPSETVIVSTRLDALLGLASVLDAAGRMGDKALNPLIKLLDFLIRQTFFLSTQNEPETPQDAAENGESTSPLHVVRTLLEKAFSMFPRVVLSRCLQALRGSDHALYRGTLEFFHGQLLAEQAHGSQADQEACLAARILQPLSETQNWLRYAIACFQNDVSRVAAKEAFPYLERLLQLLPAASVVPARRPTKPYEYDGGYPPSALFGPGGAPPPPGPDGPVGPIANGVHMPNYPLLNGAPMPPRNPFSPPALDQLGPREPGFPERREAMRGGLLCCAESCLWFSGLPSKVTDMMLSAECSRYGSVEQLFSIDRSREDAFVVFQTMRDAIYCFEHMSGCSPWGGRPLHVEFCSSLPVSSAMRRMSRLASNHVWLAGPGGTALQDAVMALRKQGLPEPTNVRVVMGRTPGVMMEFANVAYLQAVLDALQPLVAAYSGRLPPPPLPPPPLPPMPGNPAAMDSPTLQPVLDAPYLPRSLWIGQLPPDTSEEELMRLFRRFGEITHCRLNRAMGSAVVVFASPVVALEAQKAVNGVRLRSATLQVELKVDDAPPHHLLRTSPLPPDAARMPIRMGDMRPPALGLGGRMPLPWRGERDMVGVFRQRVRETGWGPPDTGVPYGVDVGMGLPPPPTRPPASDWPPQPASPPPPPPDEPPPLPPPPPPLPMHTSDTPPTQELPPPPPIMSMLLRPHLGPPHGAPHPHSMPLPSQPLLPHFMGGVMAPSSSGPSRLPPPPGGAAPPDDHPRHGARQEGRSNGPSALPHSSSMVLAPGPALAQTSWSGRLLKSGGMVCSLQCREGPFAMVPGVAGQEPMCWPDVLDVNQRVDIKYVLHTLFKSVVQQNKAVRKLVPGPGEDQRMRKFHEYLEQRSRAGVIKLPGVPGEPPVGPRVMYLLPPSSSICQVLDVVWEPRDFLLALVVPEGIKV